MKTAIEVLFDKRFGWRFKIANLVMGDYLRNYLAVGVLLPLDDIIEYKNDKEWVEHQAKKARKSIIDIMEM